MGPHPLILWSALLTLACSDKSVDTSSDTQDTTERNPYLLGSLTTCPNALNSFDRFTEEASQRGVDFSASGWEEYGPCGAPPGGIAATDLDGDGDVDLLFTRIHQAPALYENSGGNFSSVDIGLDTPTEQANFSISAVDIDGDGLPELFSTGLGYLAMSTNLGDLNFGEWEFIHRSEDYPMDCFITVAHGDVDGDHDIDIFLPALDQAENEDTIMPEDFDDYLTTTDRFFTNEDGVFTEVLQLSQGDDENGLSLLALFTDRDGDRDLDILHGADRPFVGIRPPTAFWRNEGPDWDGLPRLVNDSDEIGADAYISAMGVGTADLNGDGAMDYCMTDIASELTCLFSSGNGNYYDGAYASGLYVDTDLHPDTPEDWDEEKEDEGIKVWVGWGLALVDFDADGNVDMAATAGPTPDQGTIFASTSHEFQPDWIWRGQPDGTFSSEVDSVAFGSPEAHYGLVSADLDGDGFRELIVGAAEGAPEIWNNPCGSGSWLEIHLVGPGNNRQGYGSRVSVVAGSDRWIQELHALVAGGQSPASLHFGLGNHSTVDTLKVRWLDGEETLVEDFAPNRVVTVYHPDAER